MFISHHVSTRIKFPFCSALSLIKILSPFSEDCLYYLFSHARSWTGNLPHPRGVWTLVGSRRRGCWRERVPCRRFWSSQATPAAVTVVSQTLAGPASIWASLCVYSAPAFTGKEKYTEMEISFAVAAQEGQYDNKELNVFEAVKNKSLNRIIKTCCKYLAAQMFPVTFSSNFLFHLRILIYCNYLTGIVSWYWYWNCQQIFIIFALCFILCLMCWPAGAWVCIFLKFGLWLWTHGNQNYWRLEC